MTTRWKWLPVLLLAVPSLALSQEKPKEGEGEKPEGGGEETFTVEETEEKTAPTEEQATPVVIEEDTALSPKATQPEETLGETRVSWQDIVVVKHKPFLKMNRFELAPAIARTLNDNMIKHTALHAMATYYLTDALGVGAEVMCIDFCSGGIGANPIGGDFGETYRLVASQDRRLPTLNKYNFGAALNFHYSPIYAKFAVFNRKIVHLEGYFTAGVGFTQTEIIPRDPALQSWTNDFLITPNVGITMRVFLFDWITLSLGVRDYIFLDQYESPDRSQERQRLMGWSDAQELQNAMDEADTKLINHIMFNVGVSFWLPTSFEYRTFR